MRKFLFMVASVVLLLCVAAAAFMYWRSAPLGSFPIRVQGLYRQTPVEYRNDSTYPGVYAGVYGDYTLHLVQVKSSAEEAAAFIREVRENAKKDAERSFNEWKKRPENLLDAESENVEQYYRTSERANFIAPEDSPENDYFVQVQGNHASVIWANGNWVCSIISPVQRADKYSMTENSSKDAFELATAFPYPPKNTMPVVNKYYPGLSLYEIVYEYLPKWFALWFSVIVPVMIGVFALFVMLLTRPKKTIAS